MGNCTMSAVCRKNAFPVSKKTPQNLEHNEKNCFAPTLAITKI